MYATLILAYVKILWHLILSFYPFWSLLPSVTDSSWKSLTMTALPQSPVTIIITPTEDTPMLDDQEKPFEASGVEIVSESKPVTVVDSSQPPADDVANDSNEEFRPAVDCVETGVCVQVSEESEEHGNSSEDAFLVSRRCCSTTCGQVLAEWERLSDSMYLLPIHILLFVLPLVTLYVGCQYLLECPGCQFLPMLLFMMGFAGTVAAGCNVGNILSHFAFPDGHCTLPRGSFLLPVFALAAFYFAELLYYYKTSISFEFGKPNYCSENFYNFAYYLNWLHVGAFVVVVLMYYPKLCTCFRRIEGRSS